MQILINTHTALDLRETCGISILSAYGSNGTLKQIIPSVVPRYIGKSSSLQELQYNHINTNNVYRAIGLVLDFIHRLVCGRQKIPQRFGD
jgi:hypothetical protein